jgi:hypothetical protein
MPSGTPLPSHSSTSRVAPPSVRSTGFSIRIGFPAAESFPTISARAFGGVVRIAKPMPGSAAISSTVIARAPRSGLADRNRSRLASLRAHTPASSTAPEFRIASA